MVSSALTNTQVELQHGEAMLEVNQLFKENNVWVLEDDSSTRILKNGLYEFNADNQTVAVYDGQADVSKNDEHLTLKKGKEVSLSAPLRRSSSTGTRKVRCMRGAGSAPSIIQKPALNTRASST